MQFDRIRRDAVLAVVEVEKGDTNDSCSRACLRCPASRRHLPMVERLGSAIAIGGGGLRDHVVPALLEDEVVVTVGFLAHERHACDHGEHVRFEGSRVDGRYDGARRVTR